MRFTSAVEHTLTCYPERGEPFGRARDEFQSWEHHVARLYQSRCEGDEGGSIRRSAVLFQPGGADELNRNNILTLRPLIWEIRACLRWTQRRGLCPSCPDGSSTPLRERSRCVKNGPKTSGYFLVLEVDDWLMIDSHGIARQTSCANADNMPLLSRVQKRPCRLSRSSRTIRSRARSNGLSRRFSGKGVRPSAPRRQRPKRTRRSCSG